jgi:hypothetical protein
VKLATPHPKTPPLDARLRGHDEGGLLEHHARESGNPGFRAGGGFGIASSVEQMPRVGSASQDAGIAKAGTVSAAHLTSDIQHLTPNTQHPASNTFRNEGEYWSLTFQGTVCRVKDIRGMQYLAQLLQDPNKEFHTLALVSGRTSPGADESPDFSAKAAPPAERARVNVTRALKAAIKKITASHPALGQHLARTIKTGTFCSYVPGSHQFHPWQF